MFEKDLIIENILNYIDLISYFKTNNEIMNNVRSLYCFFNSLFLMFFSFKV